MVIGNGFGQFGADWLTTITQVAPQITQTVNALQPLWGGTTTRPQAVTQPVTPPPAPKQASFFSGNMPLLLGGGVAVLVLGALLMRRR